MHLSGGCCVAVFPLVLHTLSFSTQVQGLGNPHQTRHEILTRDTPAAKKSARRGPSEQSIQVAGTAVRQEQTSSITVDAFGNLQNNSESHSLEGKLIRASTSNSNEKPQHVLGRIYHPMSLTPESKDDKTEKSEKNSKKTLILEHSSWSGPGLWSDLRTRAWELQPGREPSTPANIFSSPSVTAQGPWWLRYTPATIMIGVAVMSYMCCKPSKKELINNDNISNTELMYLVPVLTLASALTASILVSWHVVSPRTALCIFLSSHVVCKEMRHRLLSTDTSRVQEIQYSDSVDGTGRLALLDNIKFVAMFGVIAHHILFSFFVEEEVNPYLRVTALDWIDGWARFWCLPLFATSAGMMTKGRFSRSNVAQLVRLFVVLDLFWYWMLHSGSKEDPDPVAPFLYQHDKAQFFNPLRNYSAGGHLWWFQFMILVPPVVGSIRYLAGESVIRMVALGHLTWLLCGLGLFMIMSKGIFDQVPNEKHFFIYTFMFPGFLSFGLGTLVTPEHILKMRQHRMARPLGAAVLLGYFLFWITADKDLVTSMVPLWDNPVFVACVIWPQSLITNAAFAACLPAGECFLTRAGARSMYVYILHPIVFDFIGSAYKDFTGNRLPHPPGADWSATLALMIGVVLLNLILGSGAVERGIKPILMG